MHKAALFLLLAGLGLAQPAFADDLDDAKVAGLVGESATGYLALVSPPGDAATRALIENINARRKARYREIAADNGIDLEAVEMLAGQKAIDRTPAGQFIRATSGAWRRK
ncbi:MAG: YdbL family protein [Pseudomonadota bacterium]|nr:YdbL family protein [Pseudomonadota bacterium]